MRAKKERQRQEQYAAAMAWVREQDGRRCAVLKRQVRLRELGVNKMGHRHKVAALLEQLRAGQQRTSSE